MIREIRSGQFIGGQIDALAVRELADRGVRAIVNNRPDGEETGQPTSDQTAAIAAAAGLAYSHLPMAGGLDLETIAAARALLAKDDPILLYCRSGMRSALLWAAVQAAEGEDIQTILAATSNAGFDFRPYAGMLAEVAAAFRAG